MASFYLFSSLWQGIESCSTNAAAQQQVGEELMQSATQSPREYQIFENVSFAANTGGERYANFYANFRTNTIANYFNLHDSCDLTTFASDLRKIEAELCRLTNDSVHLQ